MINPPEANLWISPFQLWVDIAEAENKVAILQKYLTGEFAGQGPLDRHNLRATSTDFLKVKSILSLTWLEVGSDEVVNLLVRSVFCKAILDNLLQIPSTVPKKISGI